MMNGQKYPPLLVAHWNGLDQGALEAVLPDLGEVQTVSGIHISQLQTKCTFTDIEEHLADNQRVGVH